MLRASAVILFVAASALASALMGAESKSADAGKALVKITEQLQLKFLKNGRKLDPSWTLADLVRPEDLNSRYYDCTNYGFYVVSVSPPSARAYAVPLRDGDGPQIIFDIYNVETGGGHFSTWREDPTPTEGRSVWPDTPELVKAREANARYRFSERYEAVVVDSMLVVGLLALTSLSMLLFMRRSWLPALVINLVGLCLSVVMGIYGIAVLEMTSYPTPDAVFVGVGSCLVMLTWAFFRRRRLKRQQTALRPAV